VNVGQDFEDVFLSDHVCIIHHQGQIASLKVVFFAVLSRCRTST